MPTYRNKAFIKIPISSRLKTPQTDFSITEKGKNGSYLNTKTSFTKWTMALFVLTALS